MKLSPESRQRPSALVKQEIGDLVNIILATFQVRVNEDTQVRDRMKTDKLQDVIKHVISQ